MQPFKKMLLPLAWLLGAFLCAGAGDSVRAARHAAQIDRAFADAVAVVKPSVVVITVKRKPDKIPPDSVLRQDDDPNDQLNSDFWLYYRKKLYESTRERGNRGSGLILRAEGYILTNRHVVEEAEKITVRLVDGRVFPARIYANDPLADLSVLKIDATGLTVARFGNSDKTRVGEFALAIGAPWNFEYSVTFGHVSAKGRSNVLPASMGGEVMDQDYIQTDALINPGNSGGPLANIRGEVIGINTLIQGENTGIGFAVPGNFAKAVADELIRAGKYSRPWAGIEIRALSEAADPSQITRGVTIVRILTNGPAIDSGLQPGDVILEVGHDKVSTPAEVRKAVRAHRIGQRIRFLVWREGRPLEYWITAAELELPARKTESDIPEDPDQAYPNTRLQLSVM